MGQRLLERMSAEDVLQDALAHAWRDRGSHVWHGNRAFRSWLLTIIDHRISDLADRENALKRGGGESGRYASAVLSELNCPGNSTTPSRLVRHREQVSVIRSVLATLPADVRDVVQLRVFEQRTIEEIAASLNLGVSAVRHRVRKGTILYLRLLRRELGTRSGKTNSQYSPESVTLSDPSSSS
jgi:RNA polymerase sigma factor (sigma-70 family)